MISEGSCDSEDWSNDAENSALHHRNKLYFQVSIHLIFPIRISAAICEFNVSGFLICFQLFLAVQNSSFCCLRLQIGVLPYYFNLNYEHTGL